MLISTCVASNIQLTKLICFYLMMNNQNLRPGRRANQIPDEILNDPVLNQRIATALPKNYNFEIHKTVWRIRNNCSRRVCLQFPDGLFIFAIPIVNILKEFLVDVEFIIMADVVYGACCIDDTKAKELDCDMLVHYGHSCLVPINQMANGISVLYVFVDIKFDILHFIQTVCKNFNAEENKICLASTIQFVSSIHTVVKELREKNFEVILPQSRPLTPGEILGCTAPNLSNTNANTIIFVADGRFHLEALMIANPEIPAYRYNPYNKELTHEHYSHDRMIEQRARAVKSMQQIIRNNKPIGIIVGTLGRQGSFRILTVLKSLIEQVSKSPVLTFLISEINPTMLAELGRDTVYGWVQIGCPRLSIDWGSEFVDKPLLSPYELRTAIKTLEANNTVPNFTTDGNYHMDFYSNSSLGAWTPSHKCHGSCECEK